MIPASSSNSSYSEQSSAASCCTKSTSASMGDGVLKVYQAFIFSIPIFFTFVLLFSFYLFYLRRCRRLRSDRSSSHLQLQLPTLSTNHISRPEQGLKKELREMLPVIVFMESFSVRETQCSVCLGDYQAEDRLQQIPACGHTFHMDCIDHWLATRTTCPLCRLSLLASTKADIQAETTAVLPNAGRDDDASVQNCYRSNDDLQ